MRVLMKCPNCVREFAGDEPTNRRLTTTCPFCLIEFDPYAPPMLRAADSDALPKADLVVTKGRKP